MDLAAQSRSVAGIVFILVGMMAISVNDMLIKALSGDYALHQIVFHALGGRADADAGDRPDGGRFRDSAHADSLVAPAARADGRGVEHGLFFLALAAMPLADATALFFVAPLFITLLSAPILGERVGPLRIGAVAVGFWGR
ncbi:hypothetical protein ACFOHS_12345 [Jhaorihella thermophila]